jgi:peptidoglycan/xylan/chitin deacetylase (PgdA/CDA1 family)
MASSVERVVRRGIGVVQRRTRRAAMMLSRSKLALGAASGHVALTFDDGPDPRHTPEILDELRRLDAVATFFLVGDRAAAHPHLVRRMVAEGHAVGSHSRSHPEPWRLSMRALTREYRLGRALVEDAARCPVHLFRPPKGYVDLRGAAAMGRAGLTPWLWTIDTRDWVPDATSAEIAASVDGLRSGDIVLLHDAIEGPLAPAALDRSATVAALADIVAVARERRLRLVTLG